MGVEVTVKALPLMGLPPSPREAHIMISLDAHRILLLGGGSISPASGPQQFNDMVCSLLPSHMTRSSFHWHMVCLSSHILNNTNMSFTDMVCNISLMPHILFHLVYHGMLCHFQILSITWYWCSEWHHVLCLLLMVWNGCPFCMISHYMAWYISLIVMLWMRWWYACHVTRFYLG